MCSVRSRKYSAGSGKPCRVLLASLLLLCLALPSLGAWPTRQERIAPAVEDPISSAATAAALPIAEEEAEEQEASATSSQPIQLSVSKESNLSGLVEQLNRLEDTLSSSKRISAEIKQDVNDVMSALAAYVALEEAEDSLAKDNAAKLELIADHSVAIQEELEDCKAELKKANATKMFANVGLTMGFDNGTPAFGMSGNVGVRIKKSLMLSLGTTYMFGSFSNAVFDMDLDRLSFTGSIGWEW